MTTASGCGILLDVNNIYVNSVNHRFDSRLWLANVCWKSGLTKITRWDTTVTLFTYEYSVPLLPPEMAAALATAVELGGAAMLAVGPGGRVGAVALFILNVVAVISYPDLSEVGLKDHLFWGIPLALLLVHGPGRLSVDHGLRRCVMQENRKQTAFSSFRFS